MLSHYGNFIPKLTPFSITSMWLGMTGGGGAGTEDREGFEVETWLDSFERRVRAKVVIGPSGAEKHAWGAVTPFKFSRGMSLLLAQHDSFL